MLNVCYRRFCEDQLELIDVKIKSYCSWFWSVSSVVKRKSPVAKTLVKNGCAAMMAAIEIHNKPVFEYRYEVCTLLVINAWELVIKALIYKRWKEVPLEDEGQPRPFKKCLNDVSSRLAGDEHHAFLPIKESLLSLYKYRNSVAHFHSEELDVVLFSLLRASVIDFARFVKAHFDRDVCSKPTVLLPIHVSGDFNPVEFLIKRPTQSAASREVRDFINGLFDSCQRLQEAGVKESIFSTWKVELLSAKKANNADILAAKINTQNDATPLEIVNRLGDVRFSNSSGATEVRLSDKEFFSIYSEDHETICKNATSMFCDFKCNPKFHSIKNAIKGDPHFHQVRYLSPNNKEQKKDWYAKTFYTELAKHYTYSTSQMPEHDTSE